MTGITVQPSGQACGAYITGVDLSKPLDADTINEIRAAWVEHHVVAFPDQHISDNDLERITQYFGNLGDEPFFVPIDGSDHVVALTRRADEKAPVFAEVWHSDWSFQDQPPIGTCLYSLVIPPVGGDTGFINQEKALADMPSSLRSKLEGLKALHSAVGAYSPEGAYGEKEKDSDRSMKILFSESARDIHPHSFIKVHPESGRESLHGCLGYIVGIEGMPEEKAKALLYEIYEWQTREEFQYTHKWQENMLVIWDNRSVLHKANAGYDGYDRELHRTTISGNADLFQQAR